MTEQEIRTIIEPLGIVRLEPCQYHTGVWNFEVSAGPKKTVQRFHDCGKLKSLGNTNGVMTVDHPYGSLPTSWMPKALKDAYDHTPQAVKDLEVALKAAGFTTKRYNTSTAYGIKLDQPPFPVFFIYEPTTKDFEARTLWSAASFSRDYFTAAHVSVNGAVEVAQRIDAIFKNLPV